MSMTPIASIMPHSPASQAGILPGERLLTINNHNVLDVLDYKFYSYESQLDIQLQQEDLTKRSVTVSKEEGEDLGLEFETYLMDKPRSCANDCIFCFVDQMPSGMRSSLYFKDDDARLSFLTGNYITLTNLSQREIQRIIDLKISPINISVHSTNPELRKLMLKHPKAGDCLEIMKRFAQGNITMNCQVVSCPGLNDGPELSRSLNDLSKLHPQVGSVAVVPLGITKFRDHLFPLACYTKEQAEGVIDLVEAFAKTRQTQGESTFVWCSDEFYLLAKRPLPSEENYEDFYQLDNGVGMLRLLDCEFHRGLKLLDPHELSASPFTLATGVAAAPFLADLLKSAQDRCAQEGSRLEGKVIPIVNDFFGHSIDVAGLVTGGDLIAQLRGNTIGQRLLIPENMLRHGEDVFLDDITISQVEEALQTKVVPVPQDGYDLCDAMFDLFTPAPRSITQTPMTKEAHPYNPSK